MKKYIVICKSVSGLNGVVRFIEKNKSCKIIVATDCMLVKEALLNFSAVSFCYITNYFTEYSVAGETERLLLEINNWVKNLKVGDFLSDINYWHIHTEGNAVNQHILEMLLWEKNYNFLLSKYRDFDFLFIKSCGYDWHDDILFDMLRSNKKKVLFVGGSHFKYYLNKKWFTNYRSLFASIKVLLNVFKEYVLSKKGNQTIDKKLIYLQLIGNHSGFLQRKINLAKDLNYAGFETKVLCWGVGVKNKKKLSDCGVKYIDLLSFLKLSDFIFCLTQLFRYSWVSGKERKVFFNKFKYGTILNVNFSKYALNEILLRIFIKKCTQNLVLQTKYIYAYSPQCLIQPQSKIVTSLILQSFTEAIPFFVSDHLYFVETPLPIYADVKINNRLKYFSRSTKEIDYALKYGFSKDMISVVGGNFLEIYLDFKTNFSKADSLNTLEINIKKYRKIILNEFSYFMMGVFSVKEFTSRVLMLKDLVLKYVDILFLIKLHPGACRAQVLEINSIFNKYDNVKILNNENDSLYHALNISDFMISKFSTAIFEAMLFNVPTIALVLDGEEKYKYYGSAVCYFEDTVECAGLIERLLSEQSFFEQWENSRLESQSEFLKDHEVYSYKKYSGSIVKELMGVAHEK